ncbi:hypothetical protein AVEN_236164-1, partial [Araneus ventricosus]
RINWVCPATSSGSRTITLRHQLLERTGDRITSAWNLAGQFQYANKHRFSRRTVLDVSISLPGKGQRMAALETNFSGRITSSLQVRKMVAH